MLPLELLGDGLYITVLGGLEPDGLYITVLGDLERASGRGVEAEMAIQFHGP